MNMDLFTKLMIVYSIRAVCIVIFLTTLPWSSAVYFIMFLVSLYYLPLFPHMSNEERSRKPIKTKDVISNLYPTLTEDVQMKLVSDAIVDFVSYDVEDSTCLQRFDTIKQNSNCVFARRAKVWGSPSWDFSMDLGGNIHRILPMFLKFTIVCSSQKLDAFLIELPGSMYGESLESFGDALYKVFKVISDNDPAERFCMDKSYIDKRGWVFEFNKVSFFVTTFAPFYPVNHTRYSFGVKDCYILMQPELSFAHHDLPDDTPDTNWDRPETVRDKIRVAFRDAGRPYKIPDSVHSPMIHEIVRPVHDTDIVYKWWKGKS